MTIRNLERRWVGLIPDMKTCKRRRTPTRLAKRAAPHSVVRQPHQTSNIDDLGDMPLTVKPINFP